MIGLVSFLCVVDMASCDCFAAYFNSAQVITGFPARIAVYVSPSCLLRHRPSGAGPPPRLYGALLPHCEPVLLRKRP